MKIVLASDHGGFQLKEAVKAALAEREELQLVDLGTDGEASVDYPVFGRLAADYVASGQAERGIVFCGSGIGIGIAANKVRGIRCATIQSTEYAHLASAHNHANMIALGGRFTTPADALGYIDTWLNTPWEGDRHDRRVEELNEL